VYPNWSEEASRIEKEIDACWEEYYRQQEYEEAKAYADAFVMFQKAARVAQEAKLMTSSSATLDLDERAEVKGSQETEARGSVELRMNLR